MNLRSIKFTLFFYLFIFFTSIISAQISGTVFRDFNSNGVKDNTSTFNEPFVSGITVTAFPTTGVTQTTTTNSSGAYSFSGLTLPARLEFSGFQTGDFSAPNGTNNNTSVQFYTSGTATANFGVNYPSDYCQSNPNALTPVYFNGNPLVENSSIKAVLSYPYDAVAPTPYVIDATQSQIGTAYGVAYNKFTKDAFIGSFIRRHTGLGPLGIGGIYKIDYSSGTGVSSSFVDLEGLGVDFGSIGSNVSRGLFGTGTPNEDLTALPKTLKEGMGDVEISDDGNTLYVVNLFAKNISVIDLTNYNNSNTPISAANLSTISIPNPGCTNGVARPFGLKYYRGSIYLTITCTAESAGGTIADLDGYVYQYSGGTWTQRLSIPLDYKFWGSINPTFEVEDPIVWTDNPADIIDDFVPADPTVHRIDKKQPVLADIEFDVDGSMILGTIDRTALQYAHFNYFPGTTKFVIMFANGDILRAAKSGSNFVLESAGISGGVSGCGAQTTNAYPFGGPGGGEFYCGDTWSGGHLERTLGALALLPGSTQIMTTGYDPIETVNNGGIMTLSNNDGSKVRGFLLYDTNFPAPDPGSMSKGHGLGDLELLCNPAPIEIGNRVWMDTDNDGVQDANEMGLDGVVVKLFSGTTQISSKPTANGGQYYFGTADGVLPNTPYTIRIEGASFPSGKSLTLKDQTTGGIQDLGDNDASLVGVNADITYTTGNPGENNHTLDFGFSALPACTPSCLLNASFFQDVILGYDGNTYTYEGQGNNGSCSLDGPYDMSIGPDGNLYITSSVTNTVLKYDIGTVTCQGTFISAGSGGLNNPRGLTFLPNGDLLVNSHNSGQILRYNGTTGASMGVFSNGSDITPGAASMAPHMNIKVGPDGAVWVADHSNNRVLRFNASTGAFISTFAQLPNGTGVRSFEFVGNIVLISGHNLDEVYSYSYTSGMQLSIFADASEGLDGPTGITYGPDGKVYIGSLNSNKILVFDISGTKVGEITANSPKDIVFKCGECFSSSCMVSATASPGNCNPANNQYTVTGQVTLTNPPSTGTVTVQIVGGGSQTFTLPQSSPISYSIAGQIADGASHTVDVSISGVSCASTINYTAPTSCAGCVCYQHYKATQTAQNNSVKAQFFNSIHESPDVVIDFDVYNNGDNLENIPLGTTGNSVTWTNLQGGTITASNDIASSPPMGTLSSIVSATANTNQGDTSKLTFQVPVDYIGFYILDLDDESKMSEIEVTFTDNKKCTFTIDHNIDNCQCEEFLGIVAPQGLQISSLIFKPNTGSRYGLDSICYGQNVGYTFAITPATCTGVTENNNGKISLTKVSVADKYGVSSGSSYTGPTYSGAILIGVLPVDITTNIPNAGGNYTIRFFNGSNICFKDTTVIIAPVTCSTTCLSSVIASAGLCNPANNQYTVAGQILLTDPPSSGTVTVQIVGGGSQTFTLPQTSPISYSIAGQIADGASHTVDVTISGVSCSSTINYTAPVSCLVIPCPSPNCGTLKSKKVINN